MVATLVFSFGMVIYRLPLLKARTSELDCGVARSAFLVNNWILLFCAFFVAFATMFPALSEAVRRYSHCSQRSVLQMDAADRLILLF